MDGEGWMDGWMRARGVAQVLKEVKALGEAIRLSEAPSSAGDWPAARTQARALRASRASQLQHPRFCKCLCRSRIRNGEIERPAPSVPANVPLESKCETPEVDSWRRRGA